MTSSALVNGKVGKAIEFEGDNEDYINVPHSSSLAVTTAFTVELVNYQGTLEKWSSDNTTGWGVSMTNGKVYIGVRNSFTIYNGVRNTNPLDKGVKYACFVYRGDGSELELYVNGVKITELTEWVIQGDALNGIIDSGEQLDIGGRKKMFQTDPVYDDANCQEERLSNVIRSEAWIKATHYSNFDELLRMGPGWKYLINSSVNLVLRRIEKVNGVLLENIGTINKRGR
jgi:hypothetical protein